MKGIIGLTFIIQCNIIFVMTLFLKQIKIDSFVRVLFDIIGLQIGQTKKIFVRDGIILMEIDA